MPVGFLTGVMWLWKLDLEVEQLSFLLSLLPVS